MLAKFEEEGVNMMQRLAVQMLCYQLDSTWQYFTTTFKIQVRELIIYSNLFSLMRWFSFPTEESLMNY